MIQETLTKRGAERLAKIIEKYWRLRGYASIITIVEPALVDDAETATERKVWQVRSNLDKHGYPPLNRLQ